MAQISVIILNFNGKEYLKECLDSLAKQSYKDFEVIFVDNNSKDDSVEYVKSNYPKVKIIKNNKNYGFAEGNNIGIRKAKGEFIFILNNDTKVDKNCLKNLVKFAKNNLDYGSFSPSLLFYDNPTKINSIGLLAFKDGSGIDLGIGCNYLDYKSRDIFGVSGGASFFRKEMLEDIKINDDYFDSDFFCYYEDLDLAFRAQLKGWKSRYIQEAIVYHKMRGTAKKFNGLGEYYGIRNKVFMIIKNYPFKLLVKMFPVIILRQGVSCFYHLIRFNLNAIKARLSIFPLIPKMLSKRRIIQKSRIVKNIEMVLTKREFFDYLFFRY